MNIECEHLNQILNSLSFPKYIHHQVLILSSLVRSSLDSPHLPPGPKYLDGRLRCGEAVIAIKFVPVSGLPFEQAAYYHNARTGPV